MDVVFKATRNLTPSDRENLALGLFEERSDHASVIKAHPELSPVLARFLGLNDFQGKVGECAVLYPQEGNVMRCLVVGLGKRAEFAPVRALEAAAQATRRARKLGLSRLSFVLPPGAGRRLASLEAASEGAVLGTYSFDRFKEKKPDEKGPLEQVVLASRDGGSSAALADACRTGVVIADSVGFVRDLCTLPSNFKTPTQVAETARKMARKQGLSCSILGQAEMEKLGMGAILGVARGSAEPPAFVILEHKPAKSRSKRPVVLVGKGITFDTGGISLKPADNMHHMKDDMTGGAIVLAALKTCAELDLPQHVVGLAPFTENMPGGRAQKPGDIVRAMNGKTIEVLNTDAEGRLILSDALAYAERYKPAALVDLATLTGAVSVALGRFAIGAMGTDQRLIERLRQAGEETGERLWQLPLWDDYLELMRGEAADLKNTGGREAGTITAAAFLREFARHSPWCHLDIAASAWGQEEKAWQPKGPTGHGLRMLVQFLRSWR